MRPRFALSAVLLILLASIDKSPAQTDNLVSPKAKAVTGYKLQIRFLGLVAFAQDTDKVWAFLVNANYDNDNPDPDLLPPGMFQESLRQTSPKDWRKQHVPPHHPWIRYRNANVNGRDVADGTGQVILGADVSFVTGLTKLGTVNLKQVSNADLISRPRQGVETTGHAELVKLDQLDLALLGAMDSGGISKRLAARARIDAGDVHGNPVNRCGKKYYSYALPGDFSCPGNPNNAIQLAAEVLVTQNNIPKETVSVNLGHGEPILVKPKDASKPVVIEIVNQTDGALAVPNDPCKYVHSHPQSYRWFYRLLPIDGQKDISKHFFPCPQITTHGDPHCLVKKFTINKQRASHHEP